MNCQREGGKKVLPWMQQMQELVIKLSNEVAELSNKVNILQTQLDADRAASTYRKPNSSRHEDMIHQMHGSSSTPREHKDKRQPYLIERERITEQEPDGFQPIHRPFLRSDTSTSAYPTRKTLPAPASSTIVHRNNMYDQQHQHQHQNSLETLYKSSTATSSSGDFLSHPNIITNYNHNSTS